MKQTKPAQALELRSLSPVFGRPGWIANGTTARPVDVAGSSRAVQASGCVLVQRERDFGLAA
jgi:hypothetical protein